MYICYLLFKILYLFELEKPVIEYKTNEIPVDIKIRSDGGSAGGN